MLEEFMGLISINDWEMNVFWTLLAIVLFLRLYERDDLRVLEGNFGIVHSFWVHHKYNSKKKRYSKL